MSVAEFQTNVSNHDTAFYAPYRGQYVAWSPDGKHILASARTGEELLAALDRAGIDDCVHDFIEPDLTHLLNAVSADDAPENP